MFARQRIGWEGSAASIRLRQGRYSVGGGAARRPAGVRNVDCGLRIADCGLRIADCGLRNMIGAVGGWLRPATGGIAECGMWNVECGIGPGGVGGGSARRPLALAPTLPVRHLRPRAAMGFSRRSPGGAASYTPRSYSAFHIPHSAFRIPHSAFRIPHSYSSGRSPYLSPIPLYLNKCFNNFRKLMRYVN